jgi:hypothetical protein
MKTVVRKYIAQDLQPILCALPHNIFLRILSCRPRDDKLFKLGWKDNCYFYGDPETYMIFQSMSESKQMVEDMMNFRGNESNICVPTAPPPAVSEEVQTREDLDSNAHLECHYTYEDCFLSRPIPAPLKLLPDILRAYQSDQMTNVAHTTKNAHSLESRKVELLRRMENQADHILPDAFSGCILWSYRRFGVWNDNDRVKVILEMLPTLRRVGLYEQAAEYAAVQCGEDADGPSNRRTTRRQAKARRHHYLDKVSKELRMDQTDLNSSEVGAWLAGDILAYAGKE